MLIFLADMTRHNFHLLDDADNILDYLLYQKIIECVLSFMIFCLVSARTYILTISQKKILFILDYKRCPKICKFVYVAGSYY